VADQSPGERLRSFLLDRLDPDKVKPVFFHPGPGEGTVDGLDYDTPIGRACARALDWQRQRDRERKEAEAKIVELLYGGRSSGEPRLPDGPGFWTWGLCEVLLEKSWSRRHDDPQEMLHLAELAREAADRLNPEVYGVEVTHDLRSRAWGEYANACRVANDLVKTEWALERALELRGLGTGSELLRARLAELTAGLLFYQRCFPAALQALDLAYSIHSKSGNLQDAARVLIQRGIYTGRSGDPEEGVRLLAEALLQLGDDGDAKLRFLTLHNILLFQVEQGEFRAANLQLFEMRPLYARHAGAVDLVKLRWIEGRIAAGLGELERAERSFAQVQEDFESKGQVYHGALAGLDLAALWLRQDRTVEVRQMVQGIIDVFRSRYVAREAIAALLMLREAVDRDRATPDLVTLVAEVIERHRSEDGAEPPLV
jgi:tetratricopeptide (TPR) repeat protein